MIEVNVAALTALTALLLPGMLERRRGAILNVASTAAFQPGPNQAVYCATKAYAPSPLLPSGGRPAPVRSCGRRPCRFCLGVGKVIFNRQPVTFVAAGCASDLVPMRSSLAEA
jgi:hypothetical protein